jgi:PIN domain nuclease of toxin-antitoxin system
MRAILLDTHSWAWTLIDHARLSKKARASIEQAQSVLVSPISFFEIGQRVRLGKWPDMEPLIDRLPALLEEQGGAVAALDPTVCTTAGTMKWAHRDPFDRLLAATAVCHNLPIVSADAVFDGVVTRLW